MCFDMLSLLWKLLSPRNVLLSCNIILIRLMTYKPIRLVLAVSRAVVNILALLVYDIPKDVLCTPSSRWYSVWSEVFRMKWNTVSSQCVLKNCFLFALMKARTLSFFWTLQTPWWIKGCYAHLSILSRSIVTNVCLAWSRHRHGAPFLRLSLFYPFRSSLLCYLEAVLVTFPSTFSLFS